MSGKKSVEEIWAALNAPRAPSATRVNLSSFGGLPGITTSTRCVTSAPKPSAPDDDAFRAVALTAAKTGAAYDPTNAGVTAEERDAFLMGIQRDINCLSDMDRNTRRRAVEKLNGVLIKGTAVSPAPSPGMLQAVACGPLLSPMVNLLADQAEKVRELGIRLLSDILGSIVDPLPLLPAVLPALHRRMGALPVAEPSEELRKELIDLLWNSLAPRAGQQLVSGYKDEVVAILLRALEDNFHEIKKSGSSVLMQLARGTPPGAFESTGEPLVLALLANSGHPHSKVRQATVEAMGALVSNGISYGLLVDTAAPGVKPLLFDKSSATREATVKALAGWLGADTDKEAQDWRLRIPCLLPLLLLGVTDTSADIGTKTLDLLQKVGSGYAQLQFSRKQEEDSIAHDPMEECRAAASTVGEDLSWLGPPYSGPLGEDLRCLVEENLKSLITAALRDLRDWSVGNRLGGARLLHTVLSLAGGGTESRADQLVPALCASVCDDEADVASWVVSCVHLLGRAVAPKVWLPLALDQTSKAGLVPAQVASTLVVLSGLLHAAAGIKSGTDAAAVPAMLVERTAGALAADDIRSLGHPAVDQQLLAATTNLVKLTGSHAASITLPLLTILLQLKADTTKQALCSGADAVLADLAAICGVADGAVLVGQQAEQLMLRISATHQSWTVGSADRQMLSALLWAVEPASLPKLAPLLLPILKEVIGDPEKDPAMRIELIRMLDSLMEDPQRAPAFSGPAGVHLLVSVLVTACVWIAGKTAAAVRFQAITAVATFFRRKLISQPDILALIKRGDVLPVLYQCLEEEYYSDTRLVSCHVMAGLLRCAGPELGDDSRRAIYPELCKRLDDSSDDTRIAVCSALEAFAEVSPSYDATNTVYLLERLLIHMDDFNNRIQESVCQVVVRIAHDKPAVVREEVMKVASRHRSQEYVQKVLAACAGQ